MNWNCAIFTNNNPGHIHRLKFVEEKLKELASIGGIYNSYNYINCRKDYFKVSYRNSPIWLADVEQKGAVNYRFIQLALAYYHAYAAWEIITSDAARAVVSLNLRQLMAN